MQLPRAKKFNVYIYTDVSNNIATENHNNMGNMCGSICEVTIFVKSIFIEKVFYVKFFKIIVYALLKSPREILSTTAQICRLGTRKKLHGKSMNILE